MGADTIVQKGHKFAFGLLIIIGIIEIAITGFLTGRYNSRHDYPNKSIRDRIRFLLFASFWTVFLSLFYIVLFIRSASSGSVASSILSHAGFLTLTWIFWTAGAAALTASLGGGHNCSNLPYELPYCNHLNAAMGFGWAEWVLVTFLLIAVLVIGGRATRRGNGWNSPLV